MAEPRASLSGNPLPLDEEGYQNPGPRNKSHDPPQLMAAPITTKADAIAVLKFIQSEDDLDHEDVVALLDKLRDYIQEA